MKSLLIIKLFLTILFLFTFSTFAQTPQKIEKELISLYAKVSKNSAYSGDSDFDSLAKANDDFKVKMLQYTKIGATLKYKFDELNKEITITTSEDGKLRAYSWDRLDGGTMHFFETVYQFLGQDSKVYSQTVEREEGDAGGFVYDIFSVETKSGKIYLICNYGIGSSQDRGEGVKLFRIDSSKLNDQVKLIKTKSGLTNSIGFSYNFFSVVDKKDNNGGQIVFDKNAKILKIPLVIEDKKFENGRVTDKFINYKFDGTYFVKVN